MPALLSALSLLVLTATLGVLIWYTVETHKIAKQTVEVNLRPVVLRCGYIPNWNELPGRMVSGQAPNRCFEFAVFKNIAADIEGYLIVEGMRHRMLFGNSVSQIANGINFEPKWGWMKPDTIIFGLFINEDGQPSLDENQIVLVYKDIEGNSYKTTEDLSFSSRSCAIKRQHPRVRI